MDTLRRNKVVVENKLDDIERSSVSTSNSSTATNSGSVSDVTGSSLLVDLSNSVPAAYDMTLIELDASSFPESVPAADKAGTR